MAAVVQECKKLKNINEDSSEGHTLEVLKERLAETFWNLAKAKMITYRFFSSANYQLGNIFQLLGSFPGHSFGIGKNYRNRFSLVCYFLYQVNISGNWLLRGHCVWCRNGRAETVRIQSKRCRKLSFLVCCFLQTWPKKKWQGSSSVTTVACARQVLYDTSLALNIITDHCPELTKKQLHTMIRKLPFVSVPSLFFLLFPSSLLFLFSLGPLCCGVCLVCGVCRVTRGRVRCIHASCPPHPPTPPSPRQPTTKEPRTKNQEPRTKNQEPRTKNQEPRTKNEDNQQHNTAKSRREEMKRVFINTTFFEHVQHKYQVPFVSAKCL